MIHKFKRLLILLVTVFITFYVLWIIVQKVSPTISPPKTSKDFSNQSIERNSNGAINVDWK
ncbi:hypothetical protein [uncultured Cocleimonas sp.]|uniref:hypothetical protein n=1 Tax=uncultured Cocleimonas sp. TaxID=1051587 RepID=UPI00260B204C|nr:hypothetical protein [uncultured Cocleimonas sp.]